MKRIPVNAREGTDIGSGEIITRKERVFITTTMQRQLNKIYAETKAYLVIGTYKNGDLKAIKHPSIRGTPAR